VEKIKKIPISREVHADMETPLSVYRKLADSPYSYLFESVEGGDKWARYSLIGLPSRKIIKVTKNEVQILEDEKIVETFETENPLDYLKLLHSSFSLKEIPGLPKFSGGLVGYFSYDCVRLIEKTLENSEPPDLLGTPDVLLMISEEVAVFDNLKNRLHLIVMVEDEAKETIEEAESKLDQLEEKLKNNYRFEEFSKPDDSVEESDFVSSFGEDEFKSAVNKV